MTDSSALLGATLEGRYQVERELGRGAAAVVYLAKDLRHRRDVALKVLAPELGSLMGADRFTREIALLARLQHPHILPLFDSGSSSGLLYYVMPAVEGETLRTRLARDGPLPVAECARLAREIGDALAYAHERGIVHRDVKPENIMLSDGHALVADFGIAHLLADGVDERLTQAGMSLGTPAYMCPEQALGDPVDGRSDIYSLGCVLYEMLSGSAPFAGGSAQAVIARHIMEPPPDITSTRHDVPASLATLIVASMAKEPDIRPQDARSFCRDLDAAWTSGAVAHRPVSAPTVAVFDFRNLSGDAAMDWLGSGVAETVTVDLRKLQGLHVIGRDQIARAVEADGIPGDDNAVATLGRRLGARWVLWGAVQVAGPTVRLTPRLIDTTSGDVRRAEKLDGLLSEVFALQDRIVTGVSEVLELELSPSQLRRIARPDTVSLTAYECCARGRIALYRFSPQSFSEARAQFARAIEIDPGYAQAYAGLGGAWMFRFIGSASTDDLTIGIRHLERAAELDAELSEPHTWLTYAYMRQHRFEDAERSGQRAVTIDTHNGLAFYFRGVNAMAAALAHSRWSAFEEAVRHLGTSATLSSEYMATFILLAGPYLHAGNYAAARRTLAVAMALEEQTDGAVIRFVGSFAIAGLLEARAGSLTRARPLLEHARELYSDDPNIYSPIFRILAACGLGLVAERRGAFEAAVAHYAEAGEEAEQHCRVIGSGFLRVNAELGSAAALLGMGLRTEAEQRMRQAADLFTSREGYSFEWLVDFADGRILYEFARVHALAGNVEAAMEALQRAHDHVWNDVTQLDADPAFDAIREQPAFLSLRARLDERPPLPDVTRTFGAASHVAA